MPFTLTMPKLSPTMEEGTITAWHAKEGEKIEAGDLLFEVATDKATVEHNALDDGYLRKILIPEGGAAIVGQAVAIFTEEKGESIEGYKPVSVAPEKEEEEEAPQTEEKKSSAPSKTTASFSQPAFVPEPPLTNYKSGKAHKGVRPPSSPLARKVAKEKGVDLSTVKGSGPEGRVMKRDIDLGQPAADVQFTPSDLPDIPPGTYEEEPLSPMRKVIGQRLQQAKTFIPHFYVTNEVAMDKLHQLREELISGGQKLSFNDFIVKATALALRKHPEVNSGFNSESQSIIHFKTVDVAIAVSIPDGLITPIVRYADFKNLAEISSEVKMLATRARDGKLHPEEFKGGSFTISNLGMLGVTSFSGILNPPQAALLAVSSVQEKPVVRKGEIAIGKVMELTLSVDHRVIDGADAAKFLLTIRHFLENPHLLLL